MSARDLLAELDRRGIRIRLDEGGELLRLAPADLVDPELLGRVRAVKPALITILSKANGAEPSRSPRAQAIAAAWRRVQAHAAGLDCYSAIRAAVRRADAELDAAAGASDEDFALALTRWEAAWRAAIDRARPGRAA